MKAAVLTKLRTPWQIQDRPIPKPGASQVLIRVHASGLCFTDIHITEGLLQGTLPRVLGHEVTGRICEIGDAVSSRCVGDRVGVPWFQSSCGRCTWCLSGRAVFCSQKIGTGNQIAGGHAEYLVAYADSTILLPNDLEYCDAAPILCAGYTVWSGIQEARPQYGDRIAVLGIGGLGHLAIQFAKVLQLYTIAITHSADKRQAALALGADVVVADGSELQEIGGADILLATSNSYESLSKCLPGMRPMGAVILLGISSEPLRVGSEFLLNRIRLIGSQHNDRRYLYEALALAAEKRVVPCVELYPLTEIQQAYEKVSSGKIRFRAVIVNP